ncbi:hypothetical protein L21SP4_01330 [Kiritimatiella glycovorans]|uniref:Uncharacterized protein n=1 Tax=Kiritimatiella glycovorans TaxID=1307763 RepID=A0A0G3EE36_9BACT|nr:hypothetical protein L21SP4_01330 [Kiritimatiella glycovorans]
MIQPVSVEVFQTYGQLIPGRVEDGYGRSFKFRPPAHDLKDRFRRGRVVETLVMGMPADQQIEAGLLEGRHPE